MTVDFQKLQEDVNDIRGMLLTLTDRLNQPVTNPALVEEPPLNVQQAADLLDVTTATVYDLVHKRRIPNHRPGKRLYFLRSELMDWIRNGRRTTTDELTASAVNRVTRQPKTNTRNGGRKAV